MGAVRWDVDAKLENIVLPDEDTVVADEHVVVDGGGEVKVIGVPGGAQCGAEIGGAGDLAYDSAGVIFVKRERRDAIPILHVAVEDGRLACSWDQV
jgi:hypothetical protein